MLRSIVFLVVAAVALTAADKAEKPKAEQKTAEKGKTPFGVFKGAAKTPAEPAPEEGPRKTPFGVFKNKEDAAKRSPEAPEAAAGRGIRVVSESGDTITFERKSPFGPSRWQRKKSELDENERAAWEGSKTVRE